MKSHPRSWGHGSGATIHGGMRIPILPEFIDEVAEIVGTRIGVGPEDLPDQMLTDIIYDQLLDFLHSERFLRYVDRDVAAGKYQEDLPRRRGVGRRAED